MLTLQQPLFTGTEPLPYLGGGCFARAYLGADGRVVKQGRTFDGALVWLAFCQYNQGRKHVPTIHSMVMTPNGYVAIMDKLESFRKYDPAYEAWNAEGNFHSGNYDHEYKFASYLDSKDDPRPQLWHADGGYNFIGPDAAGLEALRAEFAEATGLTWDDIHTGNIMWDAQRGMMIVTDPNSQSWDDYEDVQDVLRRLHSYYAQKSDRFELEMS